MSDSRDRRSSEIFGVKTEIFSYKKSFENVFTVPPKFGARSLPMNLAHQFF